MTDKQIIIDGCDVSGCESFCNGICCKVGFGDDASCKLFSDCYYKQLKAKEQECERLKEIANNALDKVNKYLDKKEKSLLYKQTLTEIKEIAEEIENKDLYVTVPAKARMGDKIKINLIGLQGILDIISEVEDDNA